MHRQVIVISVVTLMASAAACASFGEATPSPDTTDDSGVPSTALTDAEPGGGSEATLPPTTPSFCATNHTAATIACADFDDGGENGDWDSRDENGDAGAIFWLVGPSLHDAAPSLPNAVDAVLGEGSRAPNDRVRLVKAIQTTASRTTLTFSINLTRPKMPSSNDFVSIAEVLCGDESKEGTPDAIDGVFLQLKNPDGNNSVPMLDILIGTNFDMVEPAVAIPFGTWTQIKLDTDWGAGSGPTTTLTVGGNAKTFATPSGCSGSPSWRAVAGLSSDVPATADYDNILLEAK